MTLLYYVGKKYWLYSETQGKVSFRLFYEIYEDQIWLLNRAEDFWNIVEIASHVLIVYPFFHIKHFNLQKHLEETME